MGHKAEMKLDADKEYRRKLFEENKELYTQIKDHFKYGVSTNFRQIRKNSQSEWNALEEETLNACEEMDSYEYSDKK